MNELYEKFHHLNITIKYGNDKYFEGEDADVLIKYANALKMFTEKENRKNMGIASNNIGNIHF